MNIKIVIVILLLIFLTWYLFRKFYSIQNDQPFTNVWKDVNKNGKPYIEISKDLLKHTISVLNKEKIDVMPSMGSLLGMIRHNGIIPWDDDIDIMIDNKHFQTLEKLKDTFKKYNIGIVKSGHLACTFYKLFYTTEPIIEGKTWSWPFIDIFMYKIDKEKIILDDNEFPFSHTFNYSDIFPCKSNLFEGIIMNMPNNPCAILNKLYSSNWENTCVSSSYNHRQERKFKKVFKIKCSELQPTNYNLFDNVWVINLETRPDRWDISKKRLKEVGITSKRWNATNAESEEFKQLYNKISYPKRTKGEIACYMSHKNLWKHIYATGKPYALIFEDDLLFSPGVGKKDIMNAMEQSKGFNIIYLGHCHTNIISFLKPDVKKGTGQCLHAYIITRKAIKKILDKKENYFLPIDKVTEKLCKSNICYLSKHIASANHKTFGNGIIQQDEGLGSNLTGKGIHIF